ncbi:OmpH family outer membrane protein [Octadecabacter sp. 1_MG-2023]|uniref:OmpH family outer membrane protein n=1 Tax=unclassified Octadecabacter TaxID=196158 RepID=UPI001C0863F8|nr:MULTISPECIES: OmpH family outer membrane protein [unclassified Octadecabacter]MBU2993211.1 OmpH family outer membrane protein [Octadecabacter sp. B2R22]MDO6733335.1 OmpH family outer membrane protein [Octadecabacter sp. 1_MG-2023]
MGGLASRLLVALAIASGAGSVGAQQVSDPSVFEVPSAQIAPSLLTVDIERLFSQSQFGQRIAETYTQSRIELNDENRRIADALRAEELDLTARRAGMDADVFRTEAEAFDEKAQGIRRAQDAKETALQESLDAGRAQFLEVTQPILGQLMVDRGAYAILDRRSVLLSLGSIDVTDDAIARIDETIGDGAEAGATPEDEPDAEPEETPTPEAEAGDN